MSAPAKLPQALLGRTSRRVSELRPGEKGYISFADMRVNLRGECFVDPTSRMMDKWDYLTIEIRRDANGLHAVVGEDLIYEPRKIPWVLHWNLLPVVSVTVGPSRDNALKAELGAARQS